MDGLCYLCLVFVRHSRLFIAALWSPEGKGLTSWLLFVMLIVILSYFSILYPVTGVVRVVLCQSLCCLIHTILMKMKRQTKNYIETSACAFQGGF